MVFIGIYKSKISVTILLCNFEVFTMNDQVKKKRAPGAGRPAFPVDEVLLVTSIRVNQPQKDLLKVLGGSAWIRKKLNEELLKLDV